MLWILLYRFHHKRIYWSDKQIAHSLYNIYVYSIQWIIDQSLFLLNSMHDFCQAINTSHNLLCHCLYIPMQFILLCYVVTKQFQFILIIKLLYYHPGFMAFVRAPHLHFVSYFWAHNMHMPRGLYLHDLHI